MYLISGLHIRVGLIRQNVQRWVGPRLPDGIFSNPKALFGYISEGLGIDNVGVFCGHLGYFTTIWYVNWIFPPFWYVVQRKIWQPWIGLGLFTYKASSPTFSFV
jgi:hypothetical protein